MTGCLDEAAAGRREQRGRLEEHELVRLVEVELVLEHAPDPIRGGHADAVRH